MGEYQAELFNELTNAKEFGNAFANKQVSERKLALGSMLKVKVMNFVTIVGNTVTFRFFKPPNTTPKRVWMKFPVRSDEVKEQLARYKGLNEFKLPTQIESENPVKVGSSEVKLEPRSSETNAEPRSYEILPSPDGVRFERQFEIDPKQWIKSLDGPPVQLLIVWEMVGERSGVKQAYEITDPVTGDSYRIKPEEVAGWAVGVKSAARSR